MERFKRTFSVRKKKDALPESSKPHQWQEDERKVREATCSFQVKYLGCIEVFESRGIQICEEAVKALKSRKSRSVWSRMSLRKKKSDSQTSKSGHHHAMLYVTGDALRVVDEVSKGLIVDQTIEKVSFCAPDRNYEKGFAYICRDGTTRRWMCHGFLATKESGERLSHAVGCAFAICLEKKQQREKEKVTVMYNENGTSFTRMGSFRPTTLTERLTDPQSAIVADPVPVRRADNEFAVQRPHAPQEFIERQGSFRGFDKLSDSSPFKRNLSLRQNELPSTIQRQQQMRGGAGGGLVGPQGLNESTVSAAFSTILETAEETPDTLADQISSLRLTGNLSTISGNLPETSGNRPMTSGNLPQATAAFPTTTAAFSPTVQQQQQRVYAAPGSFNQQLLLQQQLAQQLLLLRNNCADFMQGGSLETSFSSTANSLFAQQPPSSNIPSGAASGGAVVIPSNPWGPALPPQPPLGSPTGRRAPPGAGGVSDAESWLNSTANFIDPFAGVPPVVAGGGHRPRGTSTSGGGGGGLTPDPFSGAATPSVGWDPFADGGRGVGGHQTAVAAVVHSPPVMLSPSGVANGGRAAWQPVDTATVDPFDSVWAAKGAAGGAALPAATVNPFQLGAASTTANQASASFYAGSNQQPAFQVKI